MFAAGKRNSYVTVKKPGVGQDSIGQPVQTWTDHASMWARITHPSGNEALKAGAVVSTVKANVRVCYRTDITAAMRVYHGAVIYRILAVLPNETSKEYTDLTCEVTQ